MSCVCVCVCMCVCARVRAFWCMSLSVSASVPVCLHVCRRYALLVAGLASLALVAIIVVTANADHHEDVSLVRSIDRGIGLCVHVLVELSAKEMKEKHLESTNALKTYFKYGMAKSLLPKIKTNPE